MKTNKTTQRWLGLFIGVVATFFFIDGALQADPMGLSLEVAQIKNLPGDGSGQITFGAGPQVVGSSGATVDTDAETLSNGNVRIEFGVIPERGAPLAHEMDSVSRILFTNMQWGEPSIPRVHVEDTFYFYFTKDGVPQPNSDPFNLGIPIVSDPYGREFNVVANGNPERDASLVFGISTAALAVDTELRKLGFGGGAPEPDFPSDTGLIDILGLDESVNGLYFGLEVSYVPEPTILSLCLVGMVFAGFVFYRRRCREG